MGRIERALISVSDKNGIVEFSHALAQLGIELVSTGGTAALLRKSKIAVKDVAELTGFPEMMDGRVKTLHPKIHGGILALRDNSEHVAKMKEHGIAAIDLVVVNLYPFEATVARGASFDGSGPVVAGGMMYVLSGDAGFVGRPGNVLLAFAPE